MRVDNKTDESAKSVIVSRPVIPPGFESKPFDPTVRRPSPVYEPIPFSSFYDPIGDRPVYQPMAFEYRTVSTADKKLRISPVCQPMAFEYRTGSTADKKLRISPVCQPMAFEYRTGSTADKKLRIPPTYLSDAKSVEPLTAWIGFASFNNRNVTQRFEYHTDRQKLQAVLTDFETAYQAFLADATSHVLILQEFGKMFAYLRRYINPDTVGVFFTQERHTKWFSSVIILYKRRFEDGWIQIKGNDWTDNDTVPTFDDLTAARFIHFRVHVWKNQSYQFLDVTAIHGDVPKSDASRRWYCDRLFAKCLANRRTPLLIFGDTNMEIENSWKYRPSYLTVYPTIDDAPGPTSRYKCLDYAFVNDRLQTIASGFAWSIAGPSYDNGSDHKVVLFRMQLRFPAVSDDRSNTAVGFRGRPTIPYACRPTTGRRGGRMPFESRPRNTNNEQSTAAERGWTAVRGRRR